MPLPAWTLGCGSGSRPCPTRPDVCEWSSEANKGSASARGHLCSYARHSFQREARRLFLLSSCSWVLVRPSGRHPSENNFAEGSNHEIHAPLSTPKSHGDDLKCAQLRDANRKCEIRPRGPSRPPRAEGRTGLRGLALRRQAGAEGVRPEACQERKETPPCPDRRRLP